MLYYCKIISMERNLDARKRKRRRRRRGKKSPWNELRENRPIVFCGHPVRNGWLRLANATDRYVIIFASYRIRCWLNGYVRRVPFHPFHRRTYTALLYRVIVTRASNFRDLLNSIPPNDDSPQFLFSLSLSLSSSTILFYRQSLLSKDFTLAQICYRISFRKNNLYFSFYFITL